MSAARTSWTSGAPWGKASGSEPTTGRPSDDVSRPRRPWSMRPCRSSSPDRPAVSGPGGSDPGRAGRRLPRRDLHRARPRHGWPAATPGTPVRRHAVFAGPPPMLLLFVPFVAAARRTDTPRVGRRHGPGRDRCGFGGSVCRPTGSRSRRCSRRSSSAIPKSSCVALLVLGGPLERGRGGDQAVRGASCCWQKRTVWHSWSSDRLGRRSSRRRSCPGPSSSTNCHSSRRTLARQNARRLRVRAVRS